MSYYKEIEKAIREKYGIKSGTFKMGIVRPCEDAVKEYIRSGTGWKMSENDFIVRYVAYLDEMAKSGQTEFEVDRDILWEKFSEEWLDESRDNQWRAIEEVVDDVKNIEYFCYFLNRDYDLEWDEVEDYFSCNFEQNVGWCAEYFDLSSEELNDIVKKLGKVEVDYIGNAIHYEQEGYDNLDYIETYKVA